jgi:cyclic lactone autoinducer peptide
MKKAFYSILGIAVVALIFIANVASASACVFGPYQPEVPESLRK